MSVTRHCSSINLICPIKLFEVACTHKSANQRWNASHPLEYLHMRLCKKCAMLVPRTLIIPGMLIYINCIYTLVQEWVWLYIIKTKIKYIFAMKMVRNNRIKIKFAICPVINYQNQNHIHLNLSWYSIIKSRSYRYCARQSIIKSK